MQNVGLEKLSPYDYNKYKTESSGTKVGMR